MLFIITLERFLFSVTQIFGMHNYFHIDPHVLIRDESLYYNKFVAFNYDKVETIFLSELEYHLLKSLHNASKKIAEISRTINLDVSTCKNIVQGLLEKGLIIDSEEKINLGLITRDTLYPESLSKFKIPFLSSPISVDIFITNRCNLHCVHCFSADDKKDKKDMALEDLTRLFDRLERNVVFEVRLNGGEPLVHPNIVDIIDDLEGRRFRKVLITNGTLLTDNVVKLLKSSGVIPTVSLDDSISEEHDRFRGISGSHEATLRGLKLLFKNQVQYGINTCIHRGNRKRFHKIIDLAKKYGAYRVSFLDLKNTGRMRKNTQWFPSVNEYQRMLPALYLARKMYEEIDVSYDVFLHCHPLQESIHEFKKGIISCSAGKSRMSIDSDGYVYPCNMVISDQKWSMGNVLHETISDIWFNEKWASFRGDVRIDDLLACNECERKSSCVDLYCRLYPYAATGDFFAPHPNCPNKE